MGPKVFINCAGFIKIDTKELSDRYNLPLLAILATLKSILTADFPHKKNFE